MEFDFKTLTVEDYKRNAREGYDARLLTAQAPYVEDRVCMYGRLCSDGIFRKCAIGTAWPDDVARDKACMGSINSTARPLVEHMSESDIGTLFIIQGAHDNWADERNRRTRDKLRKKFLRLIDHPKRT